MSVMRLGSMDLLPDLRKLIEVASIGKDVPNMERLNLLAMRRCAYLGCTTLTPFMDASSEGVARQKKTKLCSRCKIVRYCSAACQKLDFNDHKASCKAAAKLKETQQGLAP